jgi:hypothetical protein
MQFNAWKNIRFVAVLVAFFLGVILIYVYHENNKAHMYSVASCELIRLTDGLNKYYAKQNEYPNTEKWGSTIVQFIDTAYCGRHMDIATGKFVDPWGKFYCYNRLSNDAVDLFSTSKFVVSADKQNLEERYIVYELRGGTATKTNRKFLEKCDL